MGLVFNRNLMLERIYLNCNANTKDLAGRRTDGRSRCGWMFIQQGAVSFFYNSDYLSWQQDAINLLQHVRYHYLSVRRAFNIQKDN